MNGKCNGGKEQKMEKFDLDVALEKSKLHEWAPEAIDAYKKDALKKGRPVSRLYWFRIPIEIWVTSLTIAAGLSAFTFAVGLVIWLGWLSNKRAVKIGESARNKGATVVLHELKQYHKVVKDDCLGGRPADIAAVIEVDGRFICGMEGGKTDEPAVNFDDCSNV